MHYSYRTPLVVLIAQTSYGGDTGVRLQESFRMNADSLLAEARALVTGASSGIGAAIAKALAHGGEKAAQVDCGSGRAVDGGAEK